MIGPQNDGRSLGLMDFWTGYANDYAELSHMSMTNVLHPAITEIVRQVNPAHLLDFGCGDGRLLQSLRFVRDLRAYDPSPVMLALAKKRVGPELEFAYTDLEAIPQNFFDVVICSLVLMTIGQSSRFLSDVKALASSARPRGLVLVAVTHPCFRTAVFSDFATDYSNGLPFDYFAEGQPFTVTIRDEQLHKSIAFSDYHWSLGFTLNAIAGAGLVIRNVDELKDRSGVALRNSLVPPYLIVCATKEDPVTSSDQGLEGA